MWQAKQDDLAFNAAREGCALRAYPDGKAPPTVAWGFGVNKDGLKVGEIISYEKAIADYLALAPIYEADVNDIFGDVPPLQHQGGAIFSACYNCGGTTVREATGFINAVKTLIRTPRPPANAPETDKIAWQDIRDEAGFQFTTLKPKNKRSKFHNLSRRMQEGALFMSGNYGDLRFHPFWPETYDVRANPPPPMYLVKMPVFR